MSLLEVRHLSKSFGGIAAVQDVSFAVDEGLVYSVIGPNGAGKTTVFNLITGIYTPSAGQVFVDGHDVTGLPPHRLASLGVSRTFQNLQVCMNMSALENVMVGAHLKLDRNLVKAMLRFGGLARRDHSLREEAAELMRFAGLASYVDARADSMPYGALKRLEIARALAAKPRLLFLDEPAAGLNPAETVEIDELIGRITYSGITVVLVEHDMKMVMNLSDRVLVLDYGKRLAEGSVDEVRANPAVIEAYLGVHA